MDALLPKLRVFIENFLSDNKIRNVDLRDLNLNTSLDLDLNLFDLEMDLFLTDFIQAFKIDYSGFDWKNYGYPRGTFLILLVRSFLNYKLRWVKRFSHSLYKPRIRVYTLQQAIETGILI